MIACAYQIPRSAQGRDRYFGRFDGCAFFDQPCSIVVLPPTHDKPVRDALGAPMRVKDLAIHVSGYGPYGKKTGPGFIRAVGDYSVDWLGKDHRGAGFGFDGPEGACLVTWDDESIGTHSTDEWQHVAFWSASDGYVSTAGLLSIAHDGAPFDAEYVVKGIDDVKRETQLRIFPDLSRQHERSVRRLLEGLVGVSNQPSLAERPFFHLERAGRWKYRWVTAS